MGAEHRDDRARWCGAGPIFPDADARRSVVSSSMSVLSRYTTRGYSGRDDVHGMAAVRNARAASDGSEDFVTVEEMASSYEHLQRCDPATDIRIVEDWGEIVGYARTTWEDVAEGHRVHWVIAEALPDRSGVEDDLFGWAETRAKEIAAEQGSTAPRLRTWADEATRRAVSLRERGYQPIRFGATLVRPHLDDIPQRALPEGVEVRPVTGSELRAIWEADVEAFRDHWGFVEQSEADWARFVDQPHFDPSLWRVAWSGEAVVGQVRSFIDHEQNDRLGRLRGWTEDISTAREWRGRGIASALICLGLHALAERGMEEAALGVDTQNPTGAFRLYRSLGFEEDRLYGEYDKALADA